MKIYELISIIGGTVVLAWIGYGFLFESTIDSPIYKKISHPSGIDIRQYKSINVVQHNMSNQSASFRHLFKYISGNNKQKQKIPMTAPVIESNGRMMFVLPNEMSDAPQPSDPTLQIKEFKQLTVAVLSFRGNAGKSQKKKAQLKRTLKKNNIRMSDQWFICQFNSPWVFPYFRKNEIWIKIDI